MGHPTLTSMETDTMGRTQMLAIAWIKDFILNTGTIFSGVIGSIISGVVPTFFPRFNARLGYEVTAIVSVLIGSYRSYRKQYSRAEQLADSLAAFRKEKKCELQLLEISAEPPRASTIPGKQLLSVRARIHIKNGQQPTSVLLRAISIERVPEAEFAAPPYWSSGQGKLANVVSLGSGEQKADVLNCTFIIPNGTIGSRATIEYEFDENYQGLIAINGELSFPAIAFA